LGTLQEEQRRDFEMLASALGRRFNPENQSELYRVQLRNRVRMTEETLPELSQDIRRLVRLAYPEAPPRMIGVLAKDHFIDAINDSDMRWRLYQLKVSDLEEATTAAVEVETYKKAESQRSGQKKYVREIDTQKKILPYQEPETSGLQKQIDMLTKMFMELRGSMSGGSPAPRSKSFSCFRCGEEGHFMRNCRKNVYNNIKKSN
jgi:hypothetical protein